jgi:hypothetical protein
MKRIIHGDYVLTAGGGEGVIPFGDPCTTLINPFGLLFILSQPFQKASFLQGFNKINNPGKPGLIKVVRREGDSNPRYSYPYGSLANCWFKPLTHLSNKY